MKKIKIMIELPVNYFFEKDELDILSSFAGRFGDSFQQRLLDGAVEKALKEVKIPDIQISANEVKEKMLEILAEKAINK